MNYIVIKSTPYHEIRKYDEPRSMLQERRNRVTRGDLALNIDYTDVLHPWYTNIYIFDNNKWIKYYKQHSWFQLHDVQVDTREYSGYAPIMHHYTYAENTDYFIYAKKLAYISHTRTKKLTEVKNE